MWKISKGATSRAPVGANNYEIYFSTRANSWFLEGILIAVGKQIDFRIGACEKVNFWLFEITVVFVERDVKNGENHLKGKMTKEGLNQDDWWTYKTFQEIFTLLNQLVILFSYHHYIIVKYNNTDLQLCYQVRILVFDNTC